MEYCMLFLFVVANWALKCLYKQLCMSNVGLPLDQILDKGEPMRWFFIGVVALLVWRFWVFDIMVFSDWCNLLQVLEVLSSEGNLSLNFGVERASVDCMVFRIFCYCFGNIASRNCLWECVGRFRYVEKFHFAYSTKVQPFLPFYRTHCRFVFLDYLDCSSYC